MLMTTHNAVVDDCCQRSLLPIEAVQVESQTLKQALGAQQQQARPKGVVCSQGGHTDRHTHLLCRFI